VSSRRSYPSDLSDAEWALLEPLIPAPKPGGRPAKVPRRKTGPPSTTTSASGRRKAFGRRPSRPWPARTGNEKAGTL